MPCLARVGPGTFGIHRPERHARVTAAASAPSSDEKHTSHSPREVQAFEPPKSQFVPVRPAPPRPGFEPTFNRRQGQIQRSLMGGGQDPRFAYTGEKCALCLSSGRRAGLVERGWGPPPPRSNIDWRGATSRYSQRTNNSLMVRPGTHKERCQAARASLSLNAAAR